MQNFALVFPLKKAGNIQYWHKPCISSFRTQGVSKHHVFSPINEISSKKTKWNGSFCLLCVELICWELSPCKNTINNYLRIYDNVITSLSLSRSGRSGCSCRDVSSSFLSCGVLFHRLICRPDWWSWHDFISSSLRGTWWITSGEEKVWKDGAELGAVSMEPGFQNCPCQGRLASSHPSLTCPVRKICLGVQLRGSAFFVWQPQSWFLIPPAFPRVLKISPDLGSCIDLFCFTWNILDYSLIHFCVLGFFCLMFQVQQESSLSFLKKLFWFQECHLNIFLLVSILQCDQLCIFPGCLK